MTVDAVPQGRWLGRWLPVVLALCGSVLGLLLVFVHAIGRSMTGEAAGPAGPDVDTAEIIWLICVALGIVGTVLVRRWPRPAAVLLLAAGLGGWTAPFVYDYAIPFWLTVWSLAAVPMLVAAALAWRSTSAR